MRAGLRLGAAVALVCATSVASVSHVAGQDLGGDQPPDWIAGSFVGWVDPFEPADVGGDPSRRVGSPDPTSTDVRVRYGTDNVVEVWVPDTQPPVIARLRLTTPVLVFGPGQDDAACRIYTALGDGIRWQESGPGADLEPRLDHWFRGSVTYTMRVHGYAYEDGVDRCLADGPQVAPPAEGDGTVTMELTANGLSGAFTLDDGTRATFLAYEQDEVEPPQTTGSSTSTTAAPPTTLADGVASTILANGLAGVDWVGIGNGTGGAPLRRLLRDRLIRFDDADGDARLAVSRFYDQLVPGEGAIDPNDPMTRAFVPRLAVLQDLLYLAALEAPLDLDHDEVTVPIFPTLRAWLPRLLELSFLGGADRPAVRFSSTDDVRDFAAFTAYLIRHDLEARGWLTWLTE